MVIWKTSPGKGKQKRSSTACVENRTVLSDSDGLNPGKAIGNNELYTAMLSVVSFKCADLQRASL